MKPRATHTPGPWTIDTRTRGACAYVLGGPSEIEVAITDCGSLEISENLANAALIAAAPEMLEALEALKEKLQGFRDFASRNRNSWDDARSFEKMIAQIDAAIAKARGES